MSVTRIPFICLLFVCVFSISKATTWDEPWQDQVVKQADYFVFAKVISFDKNKDVTISIIKQLGGKPLVGTIKITNFYLLHLCSSSAGEGPEFHFKNVDSCYFFIKLTARGEYCIATPTSGYAAERNGKVVATYRHSYHQALVDQKIYYNTMKAIFNKYHGLAYDKTYIITFINKYLALKPAGYNKDHIETFFNQHVALECIYHLGLTGYYERIIPFLKDTTNFHNQASAARALTAYNSDQGKRALLNTINDKGTSDFVKVICIWTLKTYKPKELKSELIKIEQKASTEENGFGGDIMDPRVCTHFPNVKDALADLIKSC
ncbi:MAG: hypothetical protein M3O71_29395 [Bacteroidota bacterium]|nr:hypothetical protein [Bacteroidota bacterium]